MLKSNLPLFLLLFSFLNLYSQSFLNLDFKEKCSDQEMEICYWKKAWVAKNIECQVAEENGNQFLFINSKNEDGVAYVEQLAEINNPGVFYLIEFSAKIKTQNLKGNGAAIVITIEDAEGGHLFTENMNNSKLSGNNEWTEIKLEAFSVPEAAKIKIGGIVYGKGIAGFDDFNVDLIPLSERSPSRIAKKYIKKAVKIVSKNSIMRDEADIDLLESNALKIAGDAQNYSDCHLAAQYLINGLGDHHSFLMKPETSNSFIEEEDADEAAIEFAKYKVIENCGYISVPAMFSGNEQLMVAFADTIQQALKLMDQQNLDGWIVDLRDDMGGNMNPMLAGIGPLLTGETLGHLIDVKGRKETWSYNNGAIYWNNKKYLSATESVLLKNKNKNKPIGVLIGPRTGSSGEATAISFIGNPNTRFFGEPSWGISTGNGEFDLPDDAKIYLTSTIMADRNGKKYGGKIIPDVVVEDEGKNKEKTLEAAIGWIKNYD